MPTANTAVNITTTRPDAGVTIATSGRYSTPVLSYCSPVPRPAGPALSSPRRGDAPGSLVRYRVRSVVQEDIDVRDL
ncbi:hypothetical protein GCM10010166_45410 [Couchioplanes caeruleus subsp. azureus]|nr:hypothetical protein GCM10010166_45410 [Couchioplanes caeruleus subsp. azureus]